MKKPIIVVLVLALALALAMPFAVVTPVAAATGTIQVDVNDAACVVAPQVDPYSVVYCSIQDAIDDAAAGDTIIVAAGTYAEDLTIPDGKTNLEIKGASNPTIKGVQMTDSTLWPLAKPNIEILADGVKIHGFTIEGPDPLAGYYSSGMIIGGENVEIYNNAFEVTNASTLDDISQGLQTYHETAVPGVDVSGLNIHDNTFTNLGTGNVGYEAMYINRDAETATVTIRDNQLTGDVFRGITTERSNTTIRGNSIVTDILVSVAWQGILVRDYGGGTQDTVTVTRNVVKGSASGNGFAQGIMIGKTGQTLTNISVHKNTVDGNGIGIQVRSSDTDVAIHHNSIAKSGGDGIILAGDSDSIHHNTITDNGGNGISAAGDSDSIHHNTITNNVGYGIHLTATSHDNTVHHNKLSGNALPQIKDDGTDNKVFKN